MKRDAPELDLILVSHLRIVAMGMPRCDAFVTAETSDLRWRSVPFEKRKCFNEKDGGRDRDRTCDPLRVEQVLYR